MEGFAAFHPEVEAGGPSVTLVFIYQGTQYQIQEQINLHSTSRIVCYSVQFIRRVFSYASARWGEILFRSFLNWIRSKVVLSRKRTVCLYGINLLKPTGYVMHQQFNIQQLYVLPTPYLCVL
jgi:hypothetical protein